MPTVLRIRISGAKLLVPVFLSTGLLSAGCTLYTNSDRDAFNSNAVPQTAAFAVCATSSPRVPIALITIGCEKSTFDTTIVRVSR